MTATLRVNHLKATLAAGGHAIGTWLVMSRSPAVVRMAAAAGFDFVFVDTEHSDYSWETVGALCDTARACDLVPVVRPYDAGSGLANRIQDLGAMGLMYHDVRCRAEVEALLTAMRYPPRGTRGLSSYGAGMDYLSGPGEALRAGADDNTMLVIQIESAEGVERIDEILTGGGVDLVEVGRGDLASSLGVPMQPRHAKVDATLAHLVERCAAHGVAVGVNCTSIEDGRDMLALGVRSLCYANDRRILQDAYARAAELRPTPERSSP